MTYRLRIVVAVSMGIGWAVFVMANVQNILDFVKQVQDAVEAFLDTQLPSAQFNSPMTNLEAALFMLFNPVFIILIFVGWVGHEKHKLNAAKGITD